MDEQAAQTGDIEAILSVARAIQAQSAEHRAMHSQEIRLLKWFFGGILACSLTQIVMLAKAVTVNQTQSVQVEQSEGILERQIRLNSLEGEP